MITLVVFLYLQGHPDIPIVREPQPDLATCVAAARDAMRYAGDLAEHVTFYDEDGTPLAPYQVSAVCHEEK
jgi:hypothetical protein